MEYHRTKDAYYVKQFLGHKNIQNTDLYINIERTLFESGNDNFTVRVAEKLEEVKVLLEVGFEYVCQKDNLIILEETQMNEATTKKHTKSIKSGRGEVAW